MFASTLMTVSCARVATVNSPLAIRNARLDSHQLKVLGVLILVVVSGFFSKIVQKQNRKILFFFLFIFVKFSLYSHILVTGLCSQNSCSGPTSTCVPDATKALKYRCECGSGYTLDTDGFKCVGNSIVCLQQRRQKQKCIKTDFFLLKCF